MKTVRCAGRKRRTSTVNTPHPLPSDFAGPLAGAVRRIQPFGSAVLWFDEVASTNDVAIRHAEGDEAEGLLVLADSQSAGRGRRGRQWASPLGAGLYATVLLRPEPSVAALLTLAAGVALADGIHAATGLAVRVKWPNDIVTDGGSAALGRKLAGILAEGGTSAAGPWVALGFGINVLPASYPPDVAARAGALETELGRTVDRPALLVECLAALAARYADLRDRRHGAVLAAWRARAAATLGRSVEWDTEDGVRRGVAHDIDETGALLVQSGGAVRRVIAGEVRWL